MDLNPSSLLATPYPDPPRGGMSTGDVPTGVRLLHVPTGMVVTCTHHLTTARNHRDALELITALLEHHALLEQQGKEHRQPKTTAAEATSLWSLDIHET